MVGLFVVAAVVTVAAAIPTLAMGGGGARRAERATRMLPADGAADPGLIL